MKKLLLKRDILRRKSIWHDTFYKQKYVSTQVCLQVPVDIFTWIYLEFDITAFDCQKLHLCACVILHTVESHIAFVSTTGLKLKVITTPEEQPSTKRDIYIYTYQFS